ncbi:MAG: hypothetical protein ACR2JR_11910 [Rubrobacteraceae bacterium]
MDFDTASNGNDESRRRTRPGGSPDFSTGRRAGAVGEDFRIPAGARKAALVHLALAAWREGRFDAKELGEVRGRDVDEAGLQRALYRSSMGEIEHLLGPALKGRRVVVEGHLAGTARSAIERLGAEVEELRLEDERRYVDMTPVIFVLAAVFMAVRYVSLGLDDQSLYILAGIGFALMYGLRPFFSKMQRPKD